VLVSLYTFLGYCTFEIPSNLVLKGVNPGIWFARIMVSWGLVSLLQAWCTSYAGLMICRLVLGICEAGFFPGIAYYLTLWYNRRERATQLSYVLAMQCVAGMVAGLIAFGALRLDGHHGLKGWSWVFIVEGAPTMAVGIIAYFWITGSPDRATWLTQAEKEFIKTRVRTPPKKPTTLQDVMKSIMDMKIFLFGLMYFCFHNSSYGLSFYNVPIIQKSIPDPLTANAYSVPLYAVAFVVVLFTAYFADRNKHYAFWIMFSGTLSAVGYLLIGISLTYTPHNFGFKYFSMIVANAGSSSITPNLVGWMTSGVVGSTEMAAATAFIVSFGNCAGATAPFILSTRYAHTGGYAQGTYIIMGLVLFGVFLTGILQYFYPFSQTVKKADEEDLRSGYGAELARINND